ncbi:hypothetical protein [Corynebacterium sp. A21]|uniref:hypothetical protein n=1 Tax=Corynebacterium sp. A21 TaxID=3457318 RepID=UPI003FD4913E
MSKYNVQEVIERPYLEEVPEWGKLPLARHMRKNRVSTEWISEPGLTDTHYTATAAELTPEDIQSLAELAGLGHKISLSGDIHIQIERGDK